ncbi:hypothetical protein CDG81_04865 [Actinopolyspora erythraea]|uniref:Uncharacterized protein n=1 Tax=Actinopolyspora erythraea TaxID=414996 RepID=A0A099D1Q8_9ACTN|nr:hypothetical protein CDG81_04865 [Actinopolyspora erythraea]KGI79964.1 hypothetical protein IL38_19850 [Actinopolyspora erythraea]
MEALSQVCGLSAYWFPALYDNAEPVDPSVSGSSTRSREFATAGGRVEADCGAPRMASPLRIEPGTLDENYRFPGRADLE